MKNEGKRGNFKYTNDGNGWFTAEVAEGVLKGRTAVWHKGDTEYLVEGLNGHSSKFKIPN